MSGVDISNILREWAYDSARTVRRITAPDGSQKLQVRLPLGIEQYELDGRPDGLRPGDHKSYLDLFIESLESRPQGERSLSPEDCAHLYEEGVIYYFRYLLCFQISDYDRVVRDTTRNLRMFDLITAHATDDDDKTRVNQYRPYVIRMRASAQALQCADANRFDDACHALEGALKEMEQIEEVPNPTFEFEKKRSIALLREMVGEMQKRQAPSELDQLKRRLEVAVEAEDYEMAAKLRDMIHAIKSNGVSEKRSQGRPNQPEIEKHP